MKSYPMSEKEPEKLRAASGRAYAEISLEHPLAIEDLTIDAGTLREQAEIAREAGYIQLAENLNRAAELTAVPNDMVLHIYSMLRPKRAAYDDLVALASRLEEEYGAVENGRLLREAAEVYRQRGLLRPE